jgi:hypothetical protein
MKNKTKLVIGLASMLGVTAAAGTTAGFAWFTTTRTATVNLASAHVNTTAGDLKIAYVPIENNNVTGDASETNSLALSASTTNATDISGDGKTFYKPTWAPTDGSAQPTVATAINSVSNGTTRTYYVIFGLQLINKGSGDAFSVYLENASKVAPHSGSEPKDVAAAGATRIAIYSATGANHDQQDAAVTMWQYVTDSTNPYKYLTAGGSGAYGVSGYQLADATSLTGWHIGSWDNVSHTGDVNIKAGQKIADVPANGSAYVIVSMWIEGTSSFATNAAIGGAVDLTLSLAAF